MPMVVVNATTGEMLGGGTLHHLDAERGIVEIGYWVLSPRRAAGSAGGSRACSPSTPSRSASSVWRPT
jgi:hypothetical protein